LVFCFLPHRFHKLFLKKQVFGDEQKNLILCGSEPSQLTLEELELLYEFSTVHMAEMKKYKRTANEGPVRIQYTVNVWFPFLYPRNLIVNVQSPMDKKGLSPPFG
jgi:hypothetical protein